jgi:hypothetical protein
MRTYVLLGIGLCLLVLTIVVFTTYPFWLYAFAVGSMLNEQEPPDRVFEYLFIAFPALIVALLWGIFALVARLTRPRLNPPMS